MQALDLIPQIAAEFKQVFGRDSGGLIKTYKTEDAETIVIALGSVLGTIKDTVDDLRAEGVKVGVLGITSYRPFPISAIRDATANAKRIVVIEKCFADGVIVGSALINAVDGGGENGVDAAAHFIHSLRVALQKT